MMAGIILDEELAALGAMSATQLKAGLMEDAHSLGVSFTQSCATRFMLVT